MTKNKFQTPILFMVFNRLEETKQVFSEIEKINPQNLFVAIDGPRIGNKSDRVAQKQIISLIKSSPLKKNVTWLIRKNNLGCKVGVSSAIDWFFSKIDAGIILEDDCVPNQDFFYFCESMLKVYKNDTRVMMITGTNYQLQTKQIHTDYFFSQHYVIWGWATWKRAWEKYDVNMSSWPELRSLNILSYLSHDYFIKKHFETTFDLIRDDLVDTWDIQWVFACLFNSGLCIVPRVNLISNIGVSGVHATQVTSAHFRPHFSLDLKDLSSPKYIYPNYAYDLSLHRDKSRQAVVRRMFYSIFRQSKIYPFYKKYIKKML